MCEGASPEQSNCPVCVMHRQLARCWSLPRSALSRPDFQVQPWRNHTCYVYICELICTHHPTHVAHSPTPSPTLTRHTTHPAHHMNESQTVLLVSRLPRFLPPRRMCHGPGMTLKAPGEATASAARIWVLVVKVCGDGGVVWWIVFTSRIPPVSWTRHDLKGSGEGVHRFRS